MGQFKYYYLKCHGQNMLLRHLGTMNEIYVYLYIYGDRGKKNDIGTKEKLAFKQSHRYTISRVQSISNSMCTMQDMIYLCS